MLLKCRCNHCFGHAPVPWAKCKVTHFPPASQEKKPRLHPQAGNMTNYFITPGNWPGLARVNYNSLWQVDSIAFRSTFNENCKNPNAEKLVKEYIRKMPYIFTPYELFNRYVQGKNIILFAQFMILPYSMEEGWDRKRFSRLQYDKQRMEEINRMPVIDIYGHTYY